MRYWQISRIRLGRAARKLEMDNEWHPFESISHAWYRVWNKRMVQRLNFENSGEEEKYLHFFQNVQPLKDTASVTGFREEIQIIEKDDALHVTFPLGYEPSNLDAIRKYLLKHRIQLSSKEQLLYAEIPISTLSNPELDRAQSVIVALRLFFQAVISGSGNSALNAAADGFEKIMSEL